MIIRILNLLLGFLILGLVITIYMKSGSIPTPATPTPHFDEHGNPIDTKSLETQEQQDAQDYILPTDVVLEIGGRYGTVSTVIQKNLANKKNHVVVEPDTTIITALKKNKSLHDSEFKIFQGIISDNKTGLVVEKNGYGTTIIESKENKKPKNSETIISLTYQEFLKRYPLPFNVLVVDCEGCFESVLKSIGEHIQHFRLILLEKDMPNLCDYKKVHHHLIGNGFECVRDGFHTIYVFRSHPRKN